MADQYLISTDEMAARKKREMPGSSTSASKRAKRQVSVATCEKWQREFDREYQSLLWLRYDVDKADRSLVATLWCEVCRGPTRRRIRFMRNFSGVWVSGSTNLFMIPMSCQMKDQTRSTTLEDSINARQSGHVSPHLVMT